MPVEVLNKGKSLAVIVKWIVTDRANTVIGSMRVGGGAKM
jgi:hypothetical protein